MEKKQNTPLAGALYAGQEYLLFFVKALVQQSFLPIPDIDTDFWTWRIAVIQYADSAIIKFI